MYKFVWASLMREKIVGKSDCREGALEIDLSSIGIYQRNINELVGHVPIEMPTLIKFHLEAHKEKRLILNVAWQAQMRSRPCFICSVYCIYNEKAYLNEPSWRNYENKKTKWFILN